MRCARIIARPIVAAGGLPILLPHEPDAADAYVAMIQGLVVTGGAFDVDPALFGAATRHDTRFDQGPPHRLRARNRPRRARAR